MRLVSEPLTKVTLNLFSKDVQWFKDRFPQGYQEQVRDVIRAHVRYKEDMEEFINEHY
jgi:hypothetical protein